MRPMVLFLKKEKVTYLGQQERRSNCAIPLGRKEIQEEGIQREIILETINVWKSLVGFAINAWH